MFPRLPFHDIQTICILLMNMYVQISLFYMDTCLEALAAMTSPRAERDLLMFCASFKACPVAP